MFGVSVGMTKGLRGRLAGSKGLTVLYNTQRSARISEP